jgi:hypothetical protein
MSNDEMWAASTATKEPEPRPGASWVGPAPAFEDTEVQVRADGQTPDDTGCQVCGAEVSLINITVEGNVLVMESCDGCDTRRWHMAGEPISLDRVLNKVGEHTGRRR